MEDFKNHPFFEGIEWNMLVESKNCKKSNASESDSRSYEATETVEKKAQKKFWGSSGIRTHDLRNTSVTYEPVWAMKPCW